MTDKKGFSVKVTGLTKSFGGVNILNNVDVNFKKGAVNVIIGPSGTGKSIFLKCILGLTEKDSGEVKFCGTNLDINGLKNKKKIGVLFQNPVFYKEKTVYENVKFILDISPFSGANKNDAITVKKCLKQVGLDGCEFKYPTDLSGGMQKKLGIAMSIILKPKYLFCDEPDSGLDPENSKMLNNVIKKVTLEGKMTTVIVSHNLDTVLNIGDYVIFLDKTEDGTKNFWEGDVEDLTVVKNERLESFLNSNVLYKRYRDSLKKQET